MALETSRNRYGFVILHYMACEMTEECVSKLLLNFDAYDIKIVIVDNGSGNGSGEHLYELFRSNDKVKVIINDKNEGFAKGNNIGYSYLRDYWNPDYIVVMNNDVLIEQKDFLDVTEEIYRQIPFAVLGPDIISQTHWNHQSPTHLEMFTKRQAEALYNQLGKLCRYSLIYYCRDVVSFKLKRIFPDKKKTKEEIDYTKDIVNAILHGACYVFSKDFIRMRKFCFCPDTFLYMEEEILYYECMKSNLIMLYSPRIRVTHIEDVATKYSIKSKFRRYKMKNFEQRKSLEIYLKKLNQIE